MNIPRNYRLVPSRVIGALRPKRQPTQREVVRGAAAAAFEELAAVEMDRAATRTNDLIEDIAAGRLVLPAPAGSEATDYVSTVKTQRARVLQGYEQAVSIQQLYDRVRVATELREIAERHPDLVRAALGQLNDTRPTKSTSEPARTARALPVIVSPTRDEGEDDA